MSIFKSLVTPNLGFKTFAGWCLAMAQGIVGAPVRHNSATEAANATRFQHHDWNIPNAVCVLWFDHWGSYGPRGQEAYANWGHVVIYIPGVGYASSPPYVRPYAEAPYIYGTIREVEQMFNCTYRFWSEDINDKRTCQLAAAPSTSKPKNEIEDDVPDSMFAVVDGVPSWCWINWANGSVYAVHTQSEADWIGSYMGSVRSNWSGIKLGGEYYKSKLALLGLLNPNPIVKALTPEAEARLLKLVKAGASAVVQDVKKVA